MTTVFLNAVVMAFASKINFYWFQNFLAKYFVPIGTFHLNTNVSTFKENFSNRDSIQIAAFSEARHDPASALSHVVDAIFRSPHKNHVDLKQSYGASNYFPWDYPKAPGKMCAPRELNNATIVKPLYIRMRR